MKKTKHPLYNTYRNMLARCNNSKSPNYKWYGGKGIKVCQRWMNSFHAWLDDLGPKLEKKWVLTRKDVDVGYSPDNCKWGPKGSEPRKANDPVQWEYALKFGEKVSKPLGTLSAAKEKKSEITKEAKSRGQALIFEIVRRGNGGQWICLPVPPKRVPTMEVSDETF